MRDWWPLYRTSFELGARYLLNHGYVREAVIRIVVPLDPSRYLELPETQRELDARPGERVLDLASPKLLAVALARAGTEVVSVDQLESEIDAWRKLTAGEPRLTLEVGDGRALRFEDAGFDAAYSVSVLEHIPESGDEDALRELARVTRPGGRVVVTLPYARTYREDWRDAPVYADQGGETGRHFFQRWYDDARVERLVAAAPALELVSSQVSRLEPNLNDLYTRTFPLLVPLGPLFGLLARRVDGPDGDVIRLTLRKRES
ncbi:MAG TPA: methyltransferase domain-containing protein [Gaiellaceae bacterium]|jgi:SAM-dependent methyltransferase|nr:methyltransferase domain-containing protein [Gaiellaceae bacterium]